MTAPVMSPGERLLDRLMMGYTVPDEELIERAQSFRAWADKNPLNALRWLPKLRRTHYCTAQLWKAVEHIVDPRAAAPAPLPHRPSQDYKPIQRYERAPEALQAAAGLPAAYSGWKKSLEATALTDAGKYAPARAREALDLEARARLSATDETKQATLKRAAAIWCALLNIKEPALW